MPRMIRETRDWAFVAAVIAINVFAWTSVSIKLASLQGGG